MQSMRAVVVLFDAVGTLIYADPPVAEVYRDAARRRGVTLATDEIAARFRRALQSHSTELLESTEDIEHHRWRSIVADVFADFPNAGEQLFDELWRHFAQPASWRLFDDVHPCLRQLKADGHRLGIASNFDARLRDVAAGHAALRELDLFYSSDLGFAKPHGGFFRAVERRLGVAPNHITLVGDDLEADYRGAIAARWNAVWIERDGHDDRVDCMAAIKSLRQLPDLLAASSP